MKLFGKFSIAVVTTIALAGAAFAASITPNGPFVADGNSNLTKSFTSLPCTAHFVGTVTSGVGSVTSASFTGSSLCASVVATNLPWPVTATSATTGTITGVAVNTPIGNCTPGPLNGTFNNTTHVLTVPSQALPGGCTVSATLTTHNNALTLIS